MLLVRVEDKIGALVLPYYQYRIDRTGRYSAHVLYNVDEGDNCDCKLRVILTVRRVIVSFVKIGRHGIRLPNFKSGSAKYSHVRNKQYRLDMT